MASGDVLVAGSRVRIDSPRAAIAAGIALVTEDRRRFGYVPELGIKENISLAGLGSLTHRGLLDGHQEARQAIRTAGDLDIRAASLGAPVRVLSGGNQQKVVIGKWLAVGPKILVLDEPTRGIDVGAKVDLYNLLARLAEGGVAIILISSELPEVLGMADRIVVMSRGKLAGERDRSAFAEDELLRLATGGSPGRAQA
jgi:ABC-type sugar transport system ATPase subunit